MLSELGLVFANCYDFLVKYKTFVKRRYDYEMRFDLMIIMVASWYTLLIINAPVLIIIALALLAARYIA